ncbi:hypothetical protein [Asaia krungthepensis]|uniref:Secreted protein n=1 Tax=Asaia krungthepensis NRIC 0535 TaxID=1307925 RepID=A0ABQ0Q645_9PROT|nr:hypothetical protein [Asaia krungthepensis]GBQ93159.1 hypothetical protein AA0535_2756 [Asaia krungthepensis NRIC 0535]
MRYSTALARIAVLSTALWCLGAPLTSAKTRHAASSNNPDPHPVILSSLPGTNLDHEARQLNAADLADAAKHDDQPVVLVASAPLSSDKTDMALFVQLQSARLCGSAGCSTSVYLRHKGGWKLVLDSVSGAISVLSSRHNGMNDLLIDKNDRWTWNGTIYQDGAPAAAPQKAAPKKTEDAPKKKLLRG